MTSTNLWGELRASVPERTPTTVLKEQAAALSRMTNGVLCADVTVSVSYGMFEVHLAIIAPAINDYRFDVVRLVHGIELYPVRVAPGWETTAGEKPACRNEDELIKALASILGSDKVHQVINSLLAQSKA